MLTLGGLTYPAPPVVTVTAEVAGSMPPSDPGHVVPCNACEGLAIRAGASPRPPPSWPSMTIEVGTFRLLTSVIVNCPAGTRISGGVHPDAVAFIALHD